MLSHRNGKHGVYWRPVYEAIEEHSEKYYCMMVVNAHHMRNLPGRKSDVKDAEWIATLMRHGMPEPSFVPDRLIRDMREFSHLRRNIVKEKCRHSNHLEKFLQTHGFKLSSVLSDILCVSGRNLLNTLWSHQGHKGQKKAIIAVARKLLEMVYILLEREQYYDPLYTTRIQR